MLKLHRKAGQSITVYTPQGPVVLHFDAPVGVAIEGPKEVVVLRSELEKREEAA